MLGLRFFGGLAKGARIDCRQAGKLAMVEEGLDAQNLDFRDATELGFGEIGGGSTNGAHRSAITGKFVGPAAAARWPNKTIKDS